MKEKLEQILFSERANVYAVLDGASVSDLRQQLFDKSADNHCLFRGDLEPDMASVAPYLIGLKPHTPFTDWLLNGSFGKHWGIFARSRHSMLEMRKHFRSLVSVHDEDGKPMTFRFYDPRVLHKFLPTCNGDELKTFFGPVECFFAEGSNDTLTKFSLDDAQLKRIDMNLKEAK